jgi:hypothetical protein
VLLGAAAVKIDLETEEAAARQGPLSRDVADAACYYSSHLNRCRAGLHIMVLSAQHVLSVWYCLQLTCMYSLCSAVRCGVVFILQLARWT